MNFEGELVGRLDTGGAVRVCQWAFAKSGLLEDPPRVSPPSLRLEGPKIKRRPIILRHFQIAPPYIFLYKPHFLVSLFNIIDL